jgi:NADH-quinone oxidoreductase subunit G
MAGGDLIAQVGVGQGTNFSEMGAGTAILVVASDLEEEAPIYWLRIKQAAQRGAKLIVANPRRTKLDRYASHVLRYPYGAEAAIVLALINSLSAKRPELPEAVRLLARASDIEAVGRAFAEAENAVVLFGSEGTGLDASRPLAQACANLLIATNHTGRPNNGLIGVWSRANTQGAWDLGFQPVDDLEASFRNAKAIYVAAADPAGDHPKLAEALQSAGFLVVQELFLTETARLADVVLPAQPFTEREGTITNGERRVQRFYPAIPARPDTLPDFAITARIAQRLGIDMEGRIAMRVMERIAGKVSDYAGVTYHKLAEVSEQWPIIARADLYYGGTSYENSQGLGVQLQPAAQRGEPVSLGWLQPAALTSHPEPSLVAVPVTRLYDRGPTVWPSSLLHPRIPEPYVSLNPNTAASLGIQDSEFVHLQVNENNFELLARIDDTVPEGIALVPRSMGVPLFAPTPVEIKVVEEALAK